MQAKEGGVPEKVCKHHQLTFDVTKDYRAIKAPSPFTKLTDQAFLRSQWVVSPCRSRFWPWVGKGSTSPTRGNVRIQSKCWRNASSENVRHERFHKPSSSSDAYGSLVNKFPLKNLMAQVNILPSHGIQASFWDVMRQVGWEGRAAHFSHRKQWSLCLRNVNKQK